MPPTFVNEKILWGQGFQLIAGIDEVGRGSLAGPVVAAAVILPLNLDRPWLSLVNDSKKLTPKSRQFLSARIQEEAIAIGIGEVSPEVIDSIGIVAATRLAMRLASEHLPTPPQFLLIDAISLPDVRLPQRSIIHGDSLSQSIACASIVAKVTRDHLMVELAELYPSYGFERHKGYTTPEHLSNLQRLGPCPIHRKSFSPVCKLIKG